MRRGTRVPSEVGPEERLSRAIAALPAVARRALTEVADREDLPLVAETWHEGSGGCLVANVVRARGGQCAAENPGPTFDVRFLELMPELSSRDFNRLVVAWDEAAAGERRPTDVGLRRLLRGALARAAGAAGAGEDVLAPGDGPGARCVSALG